MNVALYAPRAGNDAVAKTDTSPRDRRHAASSRAHPCQVQAKAQDYLHLADQDETLAVRGGQGEAAAYPWSPVGLGRTPRMWAIAYVNSGRFSV